MYCFCWNWLLYITLKTRCLSMQPLCLVFYRKKITWKCLLCTVLLAAYKNNYNVKFDSTESIGTQIKLKTEPALEKGTFFSLWTRSVSVKFGARSISRRLRALYLVVRSTPIQRWEVFGALWVSTLCFNTSLWNGVMSNLSLWDGISFYLSPVIYYCCPRFLYACH